MQPQQVVNPRPCGHCAKLDESAHSDDPDVGLDGDRAQSLMEYRESTGHWPSCPTQQKRDVKIPRDRPEIICLCGSSRFVAEMAVMAWELEKDGKIALGLHLLPPSYTTHADHQAEHEGIAEAMDELHLRKIDLADHVLVMNVGGYIGDSTRREITYAEEHGKRVVYLEAVV